MRRLALAGARLDVELLFDVLAGRLVGIRLAQRARRDHALKDVQLTLVCIVVMDHRVVGDRRGVERSVVVEVAVLRREHRLGRVGSHLLERQGDVVVAGRAPVLDQLAVAVEHHDVAGREHVLARVGKVLDRPQHVEGRGQQERADTRRDPNLLRPEPGDWSEPERMLLVATRHRTADHPFALLLRALVWAPMRRVWSATSETTFGYLALLRGAWLSELDLNIGPAVGTDGPL